MVRRIAIVVVLGVVAILAFRWFWPPNVSLAAREDPNGAIYFQLRPNFRVNGLLEFDVWRENSSDYLWLLETGYAPVGEVTYGVVPSTKNRSGQAVAQRVPTDGSRPTAVPVEEPFIVEVVFQFDSAVPPAACKGSRFFRCLRNADGNIDVEPISYAKWPTNRPPPRPFLDQD